MAAPFKAVNKPLEWFVPNDENYRGHPQEQQEVLQASLRQFGAFKNVVARPDGTVLCGHGIIAAAKAEGLKQFPVHIFEGTDAEARALMVADNEVSRLAEDDNDQLSQLLTSLQADGMLALTGHDDDSLAALLEEVANANPPTGFVPGEDEGPGEPPEDPVTRLGDVWVMGELGHRLVCGDCTDPLVVEKATQGKRVPLVFTDPPYGVDYDGGDNPAQAKREKLAGDDGDIYAEMMPLLPVAKDAACYLWFAGRRGTPVYAAAEGNGWTVRALLIWNKLNPHYGAYMAQYMQRHEPCLYLVRGVAPWYGPTNEVTVWDVVQPGKNEYHPTQKPLELAERALKNSSKPGDLVFDGFLGSGTTLIACEQLGRKCVGIELSPAYCDVICERYFRLVGKQATLEATGETFDALKKK